MKSINKAAVRKLNRILDSIDKIQKIPRISRTEKQRKSLKKLKKSYKNYTDPKAIKTNRRKKSISVKKGQNAAYIRYLKSDEWAQLKIDLFEARGKQCEQCGSKKEIHVHHLHYRNIFKEEPEDLVVLCKTCHFAEHKDKRKSKKQNTA